MELGQCSIIPVLRKILYADSVNIIDALYDGGIRAVEITMDTANATEIIRETIERYGEKLLVGAGTVLTVEDCQNAINAGAQFLVSPAFDLEVMQYAREQQVEFIPGVFTPTEMVLSYKEGASMVKLFPASSLGPSFIKDVKGPLSHIKVMATGGITKETAYDYIKVGACVIGVGSELLKKQLINQKDWSGLAKEAASWLSCVNAGGL